jgi:hypothetical protein
LSLVRIPLLKKSKLEKEQLLTESWGCFDGGDIRSAFPDLMENVVKLSFQKTLESCNVEKVHWCAQVKKVAGTLSLICYKRKLRVKML